MNVWKKKIAIAAMTLAITSSAGYFFEPCDCVPVKNRAFSFVPNEAEAKEYTVTFIELGSANCPPCVMMQPVLRQVERAYGNQVKVVYHDVQTNEGMSYADQYKIRGIPTQIFLDKNGQEYHRHLGFLPFYELEKVLRDGGVQ